MQINKNFGFGKTAERAAATPQGGRGGGGMPGMGGGGRGGMHGGGMGGFGGGSGRSPYNLNVGLRISNLFNTNNQGSPVSSLNSPLFGRVNSSVGGFGFGGSGARRIELQLRFNW